MRAVYVASAGRNRVKVGISSNPERRIKSLSGASGYKLRLAETRPSEDAEAVERLVHWLLRAARLHGEWFKVDVPTARAAVERAIAMVAAGEGIPADPAEVRLSDPRQFIGENLNLLLPKGTKDRIKAALNPGERAWGLSARRSSFTSSAASANVPSPEGEMMSEEPISTEAAIAWLEEAAMYFAHRPTKGEDSAHWANAYNAKNAGRIAALLRAQTKPQGDSLLG